MIMKLISLSLLLQQYHFPEVLGSEYRCGFPGTPAFGFVSPETDAYTEGATVTYSCRVGYILLGTPVRRCKENGTWTNEVPICDDSMTTLGVAFSTPSVPGKPAELAIDRDRDTCTYLTPKTPRWWRIDLGAVHNVLSVAVTMASPDKYVKFTVSVIKVQDREAYYKRCASLEGKFGTPTVLLSCAEGKGIEGQRVHIEDHMPLDGLFGLCEVEVQVEKDTGYQCGRPDRNLHSITYETDNNDEAEYGCKTGYELEGSSTRHCQSTGQWDGKAPLCKPIVCDPLPPLENGKQKLMPLYGDIPLQGTVVSYKCDEGYRLLGDFSRLCTEDGTWSGRHPQCEAIRCSTPDGSQLGGVYRLLNKTTRMGSMAVLKCRKGKIEGGAPYIICSEEGEWTESHARCLIPARSVSMTEGPRIANKGAVIFGMVVAAVMVTSVLISLYFAAQRRRNNRKPELPLRQTEAPEAPPRPPPRSKPSFAEALREYVTRESKVPKVEPDISKNDLWKTRSLPLNQDEGREWPTEASPNKAASLDHPFYSKVQEEPQQGDVESSQTEVLAEDAPNEVAIEMAADESVDQTMSDGTGDAAHESPVPATEEEAKTPEQTEEDAPVVTVNLNRDYAAVDYDKKRESRLLKGQKSEESGETAHDASGEGAHEEDDSSAPAVPPKSPDIAAEKEKGDEEDSKVEDTASQPKSIPAEEKQEPDAKESAQEEKKEEKADGKTVGTGRKRTRASAKEADAPAEEKKSTGQPRRWRAKAENTVDEEEPRGLKGTRRTRDRDK